MNRQGMLIAFLSVVLLTSPMAVAQSGSAAAVAPQVETSPQGQHTLKLTAAQQSAVDSFLTTHSDLLLANCQTLQLSPNDCQQSYKDWLEAAQDAKAPIQFPYAVWGNLSGAGTQDLALAFFSKKSVNNWGWRHWEIVVFKGSPSGGFKPIVATTGTWGVCLDGMIYHPERKQVEFWCKSMGGVVHWNGATFVGKIMKGD